MHANAKLLYLFLHTCLTLIPMHLAQSRFLGHYISNHILLYIFFFHKTKVVFFRPHEPGWCFLFIEHHSAFIFLLKSNKQYHQMYIKMKSMKLTLVFYIFVSKLILVFRIILNVSIVQLFIRFI